MGSIDDAFDTVADSDMWEEAAAVFAGFLAPSIVANLAEGRTKWDIPDEGYGVAVIVLAQYSPMYSGELSLGGGMYAVDKAAERFGVKNSITQMGA